MADFRDSPFGKMFTELLAHNREKISTQSLNNSAKSTTAGLQFLDARNGNTAGLSWEILSPSLGEGLTLNIGEQPKDAKEFTLSQILEDNAPQKYYLSARACRGIIERATRRGKKLHPIMAKALQDTIAWNTTHKTLDTTYQKTESCKPLKQAVAQGEAMSR